MNALAMAPYAVIALAVVGLIYWIYRRGKAEGASQQSRKQEERTDELLEKHMPSLYDGDFGTDALRVRDNKPWGESPRARTGSRVVTGTIPDNRRGNDSGKVSDPGGQAKD